MQIEALKSANNLADAQKIRGALGCVGDERASIPRWEVRKIALRSCFFTLRAGSHARCVNPKAGYLAHSLLEPAQSSIVISFWQDAPKCRAVPIGSVLGSHTMVKITIKLYFPIANCEKRLIVGRQAFR